VYILYSRRKGKWHTDCGISTLIANTPVMFVTFLSAGDITTLSSATVHVRGNVVQYLKLHTNLCFSIIFVHMKTCPTFCRKYVSVSVAGTDCTRGVDHYETTCFTFNVYSETETCTDSFRNPISVLRSFCCSLSCSFFFLPTFWIVSITQSYCLVLETTDIAHSKLGYCIRDDVKNTLR
jgi:hypothetical protein